MQTKTHKPFLSGINLIAGAVSLILLLSSMSLPRGAGDNGNPAEPTMILPELKHLTETANFLSDISGPTISSISLAPDNSYVDVTFSEGVYSTPGNPVASGALDASDFNLILIEGGATNLIVTVVTDTQGSPLKGGEAVIRVHFITTGIADGTETLVVELMAVSVYSLSGAIADADQHTHNITNLNDLKAPAIVSLTSQSPNDTYGIGAKILIEVNFDEMLAGGDFLLPLETGRIPALLARPVIEENKAIFEYMVLPGQETLGLNTISLVPNFSLPVTDFAGNISDLGIPPGNNLIDNANIIIDAVAPTFDSGITGNFEENGIGTAYTVVATDITSLTYSLGSGNDEAFFNIDSNSGEVTFKVAPDFESPQDGMGDGSSNTYLINVIATDAARNTANQDVTITVTDKADETAPTISSISLAPDNSYVDVTFSEGVYNTDGASGALDASDFNLSLSGGAANTPVVSNVKTTGDEDLSGGEMTIRVYFTKTDIANGSETLEVDLVASSVFDAAANPADADQSSNNTVSLNDKTSPVISSISLASNNSYVDVTFSEEVYNTNGAMGALDALDFNLSLSGGTANTPVVSSVKTTGDQALSGGETTIRVNFITTGTADGSETLEVDLVASSVFDVAGNAADAEQTTGNTVNLNLELTTLPVFSSTGIATVSEDISGTVLDVNANDGSGGADDNTVSYGLGGDDSGAFSIDVNGLLTFNSSLNFDAPGDKDANNIYSLKVTASNGFFTAEQEVCVIVLPTITETVNQAVQIGQSVTGENSGDLLGGNVVINARGTVMAVSENGFDFAGFTSVGRARVFKRNATGNWEQLGQALEGTEANKFLGRSLSLNGEGNMLAVGSSSINGSGIERGLVTVYKFNSGTSKWEQIGQDFEGANDSDRLGADIRLNMKGNVLAIGVSGTNKGHVEVYELNEAQDDWVQLGSDIVGEKSNDASGSAISLSADGYRVAIGASGNDGAGNSSGHLRIYEWDGTSWTQLGSDINGEAATDQAGGLIGSVNMSADGSTVALGARLNDGGGTSSGHARVFRWNGSSWSKLGSDINGESSFDLLYHVSLSADGNTLALGATTNDGGGSNSGHVRVFQYTGSSWSKKREIHGENSADQMGPLMLSMDGSVLATGSTGNDDNGSGAGHARVYKLFEKSLVFTSGTLASFVEEQTGTVLDVNANDGFGIDDLGITYSLTQGGDNDSFSISNDGLITFNNAPDFEAPLDDGGDNTYVIEVNATDGNESIAQTITISVTDLSVAPLFVSDTSSDFDENATGTVYTAEALVESGTIVYGLGTSNDESLFQIDASSGAITFNSTPDFETAQDANTDNIYVLEVIATLNAESVMQTVSIAVNDVDEIAPTVSSVSVPSDQVYNQGRDMDFTLITSEVVTVNTDAGSPTLELTIGNDTKQASFIGGSGTDALFFRYETIAGDEDTDGIAVVGLNLNGSLIKDDADNELLQSLNNIASTSAVLVDAVAPTILSITSSNANGTYGIGQEIDIVVTFSEPVQTGGTFASLELETGTTDRNLFDVDGDRTDTWVFTYTIREGETTGDLELTGSRIDLGRDLAGNSTDQTLPTGVNSLSGSKDIVIDGVLPIFDSGTTENFEENGTGTAHTVVATDDTNLTYSFGSGNDEGFFNIDSSTGVVTFKTAPDFETPEDGTDDGSTNTYLINVIATDAARNTANQDITITVTDKADETAPALSSASKISNNSIKVVFDENVQIAGANPGDFTLKDPANTIFTVSGIADATTGDAKIELTVADISGASGDLTLTYTNNNSEVKDLAGNDLATDNTGVSFDVTGPFINSDIRTGLNPNVNQVDIPFNEGVFGGSGSGAVDASDFTLTLSNNTTVDSPVIISITDISGNPLQGGETALRITFGYNGTALGDETLTFNPVADAIFDAAGNAASSAQTHNSLDLHDETAPTVTSITLGTSGVHQTGEIIYFFDITFSEGVTGLTDDDFTATFSSSQTALTFSQVTTATVGGSFGGITQIRLTLAFQNNTAEGNTITIGVKSNAIFDASGNAVPAISHTTTEKVDQAIPGIGQVTIDGNNSELTVFFTEKVFGDNAASAAIDATDLNLSIAGGTATGVSINTITNGVGSGLSGGEEQVKISFSLTGTPNGAETLTVDAINSASIFDGAGFTVFSPQGGSNTVNLNDIYAPVFTSGITASFVENETGVAYTATATDSGPVTFKLGIDKDEALFTIGKSSGELTFVSSPDFESPSNGDNDYEIEIIASDGVRTSSQTVTVSVTDVDDEKPVFTSSASASFEENETGTVYTATATDVDSQTITYSLSNSSDTDVTSLFNLDANSGVLTFVEAQDFETAAGNAGSGKQFLVDIIASDESNNETTLALTISLIDLNEAPVVSSNPITSINDNEEYEYFGFFTDPDERASFNALNAVQALELPSWLSLKSKNPLFTQLELEDDEGESVPGEALGEAGHLVRDSEGNVIMSVLDEFTSELFQVNSEGILSLFDLKDAAGDEFELDEITALSIDKEDNLYFAMTGQISTFLFKMDKNGTVTAVRTDPNDENTNDLPFIPEDMTFDHEQGSLYFLDEEGAVYYLNLSTLESNSISSSGEDNEFDSPLIAINDQNQVYTYLNGRDALLIRYTPGEEGFLKETILDSGDDDLSASMGELLEGVEDMLFSSDDQLLFIANDDFYEFNESTFEFEPLIDLELDDSRLLPFEFNSLRLFAEANGTFNYISRNGLGELIPGELVFVETTDPLPVGDYEKVLVGKFIPETIEFSQVNLISSFATNRLGHMLLALDDSELVLIKQDQVFDARFFLGDGDDSGDSPDLNRVRIWEILGVAASGDFLLAGDQSILISISPDDVDDLFEITEVGEGPGSIISLPYTLLYETQDSETTIMDARLDGDGNVLMLLGGSKLVRLNPDTGIQTDLIDENSQVEDMVDFFLVQMEIDSEDNVFLSDIENEVILKLDKNGNLSVLTDLPGVIDLTISNNNQLYAATLERLFSISADGTATALAGQEGSVALDEPGTSINGIGEEAQFTEINAIQIDESVGLIYILDDESLRVATLSTADFALCGEAEGQVGVHNVSLKITDLGDTEISLLHDFTITVLDVTAPSITSGSEVIIDENSTDDVLSITAEDNNPNAVFTYTLSGADADLFAIDPNDQGLSFIAAPDFENPEDEGEDNVYNLTLEVKDDAENSTSQELTITVSDLDDEAPVFTSSNTISIDENTTPVVSLTATDADANSTLSFSITGGADQTLFGLADDELSLLVAEDYENPTQQDQTYEVEVTVTDGINDTQQTVTLSINDLNDESPVITSATDFTLLENSQQVGTITVSDADAGSTVTLSLGTGNDEVLFNIDGTTGAVSFLVAPDFESPADANSNNDYVIEVKATDGLNTATQTVTITVTDVQEDVTGPVLTASNPADGAVDFNGTEITLIFDENVFTGSGRISIRDAADDSEITGAGVASSRVSISGNTVTFDMINALPLDKKVYMRVPAGAFKDVHDNLFIGITDRTTLNFSSATTPVLVSTNPLDDAVEFDGTTITLTFDRNMFKGSGRISVFDAADDTEINGAGINSSRVVVNNNVVTFDLVNPLPVNKQVYVRLPQAALKDALNNNFGGILDNTTLNFATATTPSLVSSNPADDATSVSGTTITLTFDRDMFKGTGRISVIDAADDTEINGAGVGSTRISIEGNVVTYDLINELPLNKQVYLRIPALALKDENNRSYEGISDETTLNFATPTTPQLVSTNPADEAVNVMGTTLTFTFDRNVFKGTGRISIFDASNDIEVNGAGVGSSRITVIDNVVTYDLINALPLDKEFYVRIPASAFKDVDDVFFEGILDNTTLNFASPTTPKLTASNPADEAVNVTGTTLTFTFDRSVFKGTGRISIFDASNDTEVNGAGIGSSRVTIVDNVVTYDLINALPLDKEFYVRIPASVFKDTDDAFFEGILDNTTLNFASPTTPKLTASNPADETVEFTGSSIELTFDRNVIKGTGRISIKDASDNSEVAGAGVGNSRVTIAGNVVTIDLINPLPRNKQVYLTIPASAFKDVDNQFYAGIQNNTTLNFSTETSPQLISSTPQNGDTDFTATTLTLTFDRNIVKGTGRISIRDVATKSEVRGVGVGSTRVSITDNVVTVDLISSLPLDREVYLRIPASAFKDANDVFYAGILDNTTLNFSTPTTPQLVSSNPADGATDFSGTVLTFTFDKNMIKGTGRISVFNVADDTEITGAGVGSTRVNVTGNVMTFDLVNAIPAGTSAYVRIPASALKDANDIFYQGILDNTTLNFSRASGGAEVNPSNFAEIRKTTGFDFSVSLYPNPVESLLTIDLSQMGEEPSVRISGTDGVLRFNKENVKTAKLELDVSEYAQGVYIVAAQSQSGQTIYKKFVVRR